MVYLHIVGVPREEFTVLIGTKTNSNEASTKTDCAMSRFERCPFIISLNKSSRINLAYSRDCVGHVRVD